MELNTRANSVVPKKHDDSDKKSLNNLIEKLYNQPKLVTSSKKDNVSMPALAKRRVFLSPKKGISKRAKSKENEQTNKITNWLSKDKLKRKLEEDQKCRAQSKKKKFPILDIGSSRSDKSEKTGKSKKGGKGLPRSKSFDEYGISTPSYQKIEQHRKLLDKQKDNIKSFGSIDSDFEIPVLDKFEPEIQSHDDILDCKDLSLETIAGYFRNFKKKLKKMMNESTVSVNNFYEIELKRKFSTQNLVVFTDEQKDHMVQLMRKKYDPEDKLTSYFFKVLLPEFCFWIFMEEHHLTVDEAKEYLEKRPLDI